ncbi:thioester dehydrase [uncultured Shewanella sp.]|uniref:ApeI family dehydratase n=1 Tax=uncultured Shewanella sp. TaxID=173975 RepID=UPI0026352D0F|nr:thioester dehydrase [uncultured Shewanella sp.]
MIKSHLPDIISRSLNDTSATWRLRIDKDLPYFKGHFNRQPVLPGVTQLDWAIRLGCEHFQYPAYTTSLEVLKFQHLILPDTEIDLCVTLDTKKHKLSFIYCDDNTRFSSGRLAVCTQDAPNPVKMS